jgi:hypothetical protein
MRDPFLAYDIMINSKRSDTNRIHLSLRVNCRILIRLRSWGGQNFDLLASLQDQACCRRQ